MSARPRKIVSEQGVGYVTAKLDAHWFALPINAVREVFVLNRITKVPLAPAFLIGVLNLRGRIVTALDMRQILGFAPATSGPKLAIGVERQGELFGLAVDEMGDVLSSHPSEREGPPTNLDRRWKDIVTGVQRVGDNLVLIVHVDRLFDNLNTLVAE